MECINSSLSSESGAEIIWITDEIFGENRGHLGDQLILDFHETAMLFLSELGTDGEPVRNLNLEWISVLSLHGLVSREVDNRESCADNLFLAV